MNLVLNLVIFDASIMLHANHEGVGLQSLAIGAVDGDVFKQQETIG